MSETVTLQTGDGKQISAIQMLFLLTLGGARSLSLDHKIGNFNVGKEADFVIWNPKATPLMALRNAAPMNNWDNINDRLFSLMMMGDDRSVEATYILGDRVTVH